MTLRHVGIRPEYPVIKFNKTLKCIHRYRYEIFPDGGYKLWSDRALKSGCNHLVNADVMLGELIYCEHCGEFFNREQFIEEGE